MGRTPSQANTPAGPRPGLPGRHVVSRMWQLEFIVPVIRQFQTASEYFSVVILRHFLDLECTQLELPVKTRPTWSDLRRPAGLGENADAPPPSLRVPSLSVTKPTKSRWDSGLREPTYECSESLGPREGFEISERLGMIKTLGPLSDRHHLFFLYIHTNSLLIIHHTQKKFVRNE